MVIGSEFDFIEFIIVIGFGKNIINSLNIDELGKVREEIMMKIR